MKYGVPATWACEVDVAVCDNDVSRNWAAPKSASFASPSGEISTFAGLMSCRCHGRKRRIVVLTEVMRAVETWRTKPERKPYLVDHWWTLLVEVLETLESSDGVSPRHHLVEGPKSMGVVEIALRRSIGTLEAHWCSDTRYPDTPRPVIAFSRKEGPP